MATMDVTRFGHAAVLVEIDRTRILLDPGTFSIPATFGLTDLAAIVVTHQHPDHLDRDRIGALVEANPQARLLAEPETAATLDGWEPTGADLTFEVGAVTLTGVGSQHAQILSTLPRVGNVGILVTAGGGPTLFHPGDTYEYRPDGVDILALPLSAPWAKVSETVEFLQAIGPRTAFPIHDCTVAEAAYGIYWTHVENHGGVDDLQRLAQDGALQH
jgi:L-ascorbate metabolism protein UlaG (beta-lactamase superfamily)